MTEKHPADCSAGCSHRINLEILLFAHHQDCQSSCGGEHDEHGNKDLVAGLGVGLVGSTAGDSVNIEATLCRVIGTIHSMIECNSVGACGQVLYIVSSQLQLGTASIYSEIIVYRCRICIFVINPLVVNINLSTGIKEGSISNLNGDLFTLLQGAQILAAGGSLIADVQRGGGDFAGAGGVGGGSGGQLGVLQVDPTLVSLTPVASNFGNGDLVVLLISTQSGGICICFLAVVQTLCGNGIIAGGISSRSGRGGTELNVVQADPAELAGLILDLAPGALDFQNGDLGVLLDGGQGLCLTISVLTDMQLGSGDSAFGAGCNCVLQIQILGVDPALLDTDPAIGALLEVFNSVAQADEANLRVVSAGAGTNSQSGSVLNAEEYPFS